MQPIRTLATHPTSTSVTMPLNLLVAAACYNVTSVPRLHPERARQMSVAVLLLALVMMLALGGCASTIKQARGGPGERLDPWEGWNRKVFVFNENLDRVVLKPVAIQYARFVPQLVRQGIDNIYANFADGWSAVNNILQAKPQPAFDDVVRFTTNSVFGIFGIFDIASEIGIEHHYEDFGQTLGVWGVGAGAYLVLPLLGPSTVRDTAALPLDGLATPASLATTLGPQIGIEALHVVNTRAKLLGAGNVIDDISLDKYTFIRDAYLQRRRALQYDGYAPDTSAPGGGAATTDGIYAPYDPGPAPSATTPTPATPKP